VVNESNTRRVHWQDYAEPRLVLLRGKFVVEVSIPRPTRHLFGKGSGTTSHKRLSTGTSDEVLARKKMRELSYQIYELFDQKQIEHEQRHDKDTDAFAVGVITELAKELNYNNGDMPELAATTGYDRLLKMKDAFDSYTDLIISNGPSKEQILNAFAMISKGMTNMEIPTEFLAQLNALPGGPNSGPFTTAQAGLLARHSTDVVQLYWQDLLTSAAMAQGQAAPTFPDKPMMQIAKAGPFEVLPVEVVVGGKPIERPRRVQSVGTLRVSSIRDEYFTQVERDYEKIGTRRKLKRGVDRFIRMMNDPTLQEIKPKTAYDFVDCQLEANPNASNVSLKDYHWAASSLLSFCVRKGYVVVNPFSGLSLAKFGKKGVSYQPYTNEELYVIFKHDWEPQERLLLSMLVTTGMRLTEAASLTWERFNDTEFQGIRYFSLIDTEDEIVVVKNEGSYREVPLHPDVVLPPKGVGRLFDYAIDLDGLASTDAGRAINPILKTLVPHKSKSAHSFRRTLKVMLRDADVSKEINDVYTGHGAGDTAGKNYGGVGVRKRYEAIAKLRHPWLKQRPEWP
jgi:integrase